MKSELKLFPTLTEPEIRLLRNCFESADTWDKLSSMTVVFKTHLDYIDSAIKSGHLFPSEAIVEKDNVIQLACKFGIELK